MANTKVIKNKIKSVSNIKQITKALEIVATVKLQKIKTRTEHYREFMTEFFKIAQVINKKTNLFKSNYTPKNSKKHLIITTWTDKGLCWSLNNKLFKRVFTEYEKNKKSVDVFCIWKKGLEFFSRSNFNIKWQINVQDNFSEDDLSDLFLFLNKIISEKKYQTVSIYFNYFRNAMTQVPVKLQIFPLNEESFKSFSQELEIDIDELVSKDIEKKDILLEPTSKELAKEIKKQLLEHMIYWAILQNKTWEFASRMIAMKNAKDNSTSLIKTLQLSFNKARQWAITQEISEIVGAKMAIEN